jgi:anti-sigma B factor antagonist
MEITERRIHDLVVLDLKGRMSIVDSGGQRLREKITTLYVGGDWKVLVNLGEVPHIDSPSLGELVTCLNTATRMRATLKLFGLSHRVVELLTITTLITRFDTYANEQDAIDSCLAAA